MFTSNRRSFLFRSSFALFGSYFLNFTKNAHAGGKISVDVLVYGGTASGIMAAYAAAREGAKVALVLAGPFGGMPAQGLGASDTNNIHVIGGLCHNFYKRIAKAYGYTGLITRFEPHISKNVLHQYIKEAGIKLINKGHISKIQSDGRNITSILLTTGETIEASAYIDASYEGDLLATAGCLFAVGRESAKTYGEDRAGFAAIHAIGAGRTRDTSSRLYAILRPYPSVPRYSADKRVQSYTYRLCLSKDPSNSVKFVAPPGYDPDRYLFEINSLTSSSSFYAADLPNHKFDLNGNYFGKSWSWPTGTLYARKQIAQEHRYYQAGLLYCYATDPRVPSSYREQVNMYGLAKDEFTDNNNWPSQLYVREARRLCGRYIMVEKDCLTNGRKANPIGMGSYPFDSHATAIFAISSTKYEREGTFGPLSSIQTTPYQIPYESLLPNEYDNLLVSVCVSTSHVAWASVRMEPQYMIMGEAAGCAAGLIAKHKVPSGDLAQSITSQLKSYGVVMNLSLRVAQ